MLLEQAGYIIKVVLMVLVNSFLLPAYHVKGMTRRGVENVKTHEFVS